MVWQRSSSLNLESAHSSRMRARGESDLEKHAHLYSSRPSYDANDRLGAKPHDRDHDSDSLDEDASSPSDSSQAPMLHKAYSYRSRSGSKMMRPGSIMRYACFGVAGILVLFVVFLVRMSHHSEQEVQIAIVQEKTTPRPPMWEEFPFLNRYYGGIRSLVRKSEYAPEYPTADDETMPVKVAEDSTNKPETKAPVQKSEKRDFMESIEFNPYPDYRSAAYVDEYGEKVDCFLDKSNKISIPKLQLYEGIPQGLPENVFGSSELLGMRNDVCFDRFGRLGPYGLGYSLHRGGIGAQQEGERQGADAVWRDVAQVDFRDVKWADVQERCAAANAHRFEPLPSPRNNRFLAMQVGAHATSAAEPEAGLDPSQSKPKSGRSKVPRTAVVIRTWWDYPYTPEDILYLRALMSELALHTGGEYTLHFLIQVKDDDKQIWVDDDVYEQVLRDALPAEFQGMGTLWTERQMFVVYGGLEETMMRGLPVHGVYRSTFMPMQYFAYQHPEYDYFWNWEMDVRYTGHFYHLFDSVGKWAKKQPRKYLWERNARFYIPSKHGSWEDFSQMVKFQTDQGTNSPNNMWSGLRAGGQMPGQEKMRGDRPVWGPERPLDDDVAFDGDPEPPTTLANDKNSWGVDEEADLITFNPMFDPDGTTWLLAEDVTGYNRTQGLPPRRTAIITASRLSKRLLTTMHKELSRKRHTMFSEMWPASCALHHGLKAVYVPHPEYIDRRWPTSYLATTFNAGRNGASGGARTSVFGEREHNFRGTTWYYNAGFPEVLWHRWLGMKFNNDGGEVAEMEGEGRMCLPPMLLHPVKRVELVIEGRKADE